MNTYMASENPASTSPVDESGAQGGTARLSGDSRPWLGRALFAFSLAGLPLANLVLARRGRKGGLLVQAASVLLFARAVQFVITGTAARLRTLPRLLAYAEIVGDGLATLTGFWVWVWRPFVASRQTARPRLRTAGDWVARLNAVAVAAMFVLHAVRMAIYLSPGQGRRDDRGVGAGPEGGTANLPEEVAPGVHMLSIFGSNVYFLQSGSSWVLVDTAWAWGNSGQKIRQAAEALFGPGVRPAAILLTHIHPDHDGAALELARLWDCSVYVHPDELPMTTADLAGLERFANPLDRGVILPLLRAMPRQQVEAMLANGSLRDVARALDPGGAIPFLPDWKCIPTPGHSPGHISLFRESDRVLIAGDAVLTEDAGSLAGWLKLGLRRSRPHVYAAPWYTNWDQRSTDASVPVLAALAPRVLATSHGAPVAGEAATRELRTLAVRVAGGH
ncbi:MAG: MBL fold metallo-hydrolase [Chloroflexota bacterium]